MSEYYAALRFINSKLREVTPKTFERGTATNAEPPYLTYELLPESHISPVGGEIGLGRGEVTVLAVGKNNASSVKTLVEQVRQKLHKVGEEVDGYYVTTNEVAPVRIPVYYLNNVSYHELGARYRILAHKLAVTP